MPNPCNIIKFDGLTNSIEKPVLLLKNRNFDVIGKIKYNELKMSLVGNGLDNISFAVHRILDGKECAFWDQIEDLKIVDMVGYSQFEISVNKKLSTEEQKVIAADSLESELGQIPLRNLHINDDDYFDYMADSNMDASGNIVPVTLYNPAAKQLQQSDGGFAMRHSLLDLVLMDKAPHWSIGVYPKEISVNVNGTVTKQAIESFQRTFTVDGTSIYDFLTGEVASEANLVFIFDTYNRKINVYDKYELGNDTGIIVSRRNLADEITISSGKDSIKNCFYVTGGDDVITNYLSAVNLTGNYIWQFGNSQLNDMPKELADAIRSYITYKNAWNEKYYGGYDVYAILKENNKNLFLIDHGTLSSYASLPSPNKDNTGQYYYISDEQNYYVSTGTKWELCGAFVRLCSTYDYLNYLEHSMMPSTSLRATTANDQANLLQSEFSKNDMYIGVNNISLYNSGSFLGVTNNVTAYCEVLLDNRYRMEVVKEGGNPSYNPSMRKWTGKVRVYKYTDDTDSKTFTFDAKINDDALNYVKQKIDKALAKNSMVEMDGNVLSYTSENDPAKLRTFFDQYSLEMLKTFSQGYNACISVIASATTATTGGSNILSGLSARYAARSSAVEYILAIRTRQVEEQESVVSKYQDEISEIQSAVDFEKWLDDADPSYWKLFSSYRREDEYNNPNYISDGLSDGEIIAKCKELLDYASYELGIACEPQDTMNITMHNIFAKKEFLPLHDQFALYNYIRVKMSEDEFVKMRLLGIDYDFDAPEKLSVTFVDNESGAGNMNSDLQNTWGNLSSIATSFPSMKHQASQGSSAMSQVGSWIANGLNAAKTMITNSTDNEVTISQGGILCRDMSDDGFFGDVQSKIIGSGLYLTWDAWKTCNLAIGKILINNEWRSGIIADLIVGNLLAGENLLITNSTNEKEQIFKIDGNGALFKQMTIDYQDGNGNGLKIGAGLDRMFSIYSGNEELLWFDSVNRKMHIKGTLEAVDGIFTGTLQGVNGTFTGSLYGGDININNKFTVDRFGNVKMSDDAIISYNGGESSLSQRITSISKYEISTSKINADQINTGTLSGFTITGSDISARNLSVYNNYTGNYFSVAYADWSVPKIHDASGSLIDYGYYQNALFLAGGRVLIFEDGNIYADRLVCGTIDLPWNTGNVQYGSTSTAPSDVRVYNVNGSQANGGIPSAGWVKQYVYNHTISGNNLGANGHFDSTYIKPSWTTLSSGSDTSSYVMQLYNVSSGGNLLATVSLVRGLAASDKRIKKDIHYLKYEDIADSYFKLEPVSYVLKSDKNCKTNFGFIAQDVDQIFPNDAYDVASLVETDGNEFMQNLCGEKYFILNDKHITAMNTLVIKHLKQEIESLKNSNLRLQGEISILKQQFQEMKEELYA